MNPDEVKRYATADGEKYMVVFWWDDEDMEYATYSKSSPSPLYHGPEISEAQVSLGMSDEEFYKLCLSEPTTLPPDAGSIPGVIA